jgi:hypothetical protein
MAPAQSRALSPLGQHPHRANDSPDIVEVRRNDRSDIFDSARLGGDGIRVISKQHGIDIFAL